MRPVLTNMGLVLQLAGILIAFPIGMGFIFMEILPFLIAVTKTRG